MESIASKVFAITGGASGMGLATCRRLAQLKAKVICIGDFNDKPFDVVRKELHALNPEVKVATTKLDVSSSSQVDAWINGIVQEFGALDGAVNAAGIPQEARLHKSPVILDETNDMWNRILAVNLSGVFYCNRAQIRAMVGLPKSPRSIVNIASLASMIHAPNCFSYGVSKAGIAYLTTSLSKDAAPYGIRVNTVSPTATKTPMLDHFFKGEPDQSTEEKVLNAGFKCILEADDIAEAVIWLLSDSSKVYGINMPVGDSVP